MINKENPHRMEPHVIESINEASGKMYDAFYEVLATYQFDFDREEKEWMLQRIVKEIQEKNNSPENNDE
jgi:hypothetical protein